MLLVLSVSYGNSPTSHLLPLREPVSVSLQQGQAFSAQEVAVPQEVAKVQREMLP